MGTVYLVRHGQTTANASGVLAGRTDVRLNDVGQGQARGLAASLGDLPIGAIVSSPMSRCLTTIEPLATAIGLRPGVDDRLNECDYGDWTGESLASLAALPLWTTVQAQPSQVRFPGGESMEAMQARAVEAVREIGAAHEAAVVVSHGDVIKSVLAHALGMGLDEFQRIIVEPASISVVHLPDDPASRAHVQGMNLVCAPDSGRLVLPRPMGASDGRSAVGGSTGSSIAEPPAGS